MINASMKSEIIMIVFRHPRFHSNFYSNAAKVNIYTKQRSRNVQKQNQTNGSQWVRGEGAQSTFQINLVQKRRQCLSRLQVKGKFLQECREQEADRQRKGMMGLENIKI